MITSIASSNRKGSPRNNSCCVYLTPQLCVRKETLACFLSNGRWWQRRHNKNNMTLTKVFRLMREKYFAIIFYVFGARVTALPVSVSWQTILLKCAVLRCAKQFRWNSLRMINDNWTLNQIRFLFAVCKMWDFSFFFLI